MMIVVENWPEESDVAVASAEESNVTVMVEEGLKLDPVTAVETPTMPDAGLRLIEGIPMVSAPVPVRVPVPTSPVIVRLKVPPGVELEVPIVRGVIVGFEALAGNETGLVSVVVVLAGAPVRDNRMLAGRLVVVEPGESEMVTV
jgi:hypothetical protein